MQLLALCLPGVTCARVGDGKVGALSPAPTLLGLKPQNLVFLQFEIVKILCLLTGA